MAIEDFFRHKCDIYHASYDEKVPKYGLPASEKELSYPEIPSIEDVPCFFAFSNTNASMVEAEPMTLFQGPNELSLPAGTEIHPGDKIIDKRFNIDYTAGFPEDIRGKYLVVPIYRRTVQGAL
jgi:hypothetical protein